MSESNNTPRGMITSIAGCILTVIGAAILAFGLIAHKYNWLSNYTVIWIVGASVTAPSVILATISTIVWSRDKRNPSKS